MKLALLFLTAVAALSGRVTSTRLTPEASVWFEPNPNSPAKAKSSGAPASAKARRGYLWRYNEA
jgi:hypothetical protein